MRLEVTGAISGTRDKDYDLVWFVETCLKKPCGRRPTSWTPKGQQRE
jgi:hypothetical protein